MAETAIRFNDGAAYERMMGTWSQIVGETFLGWLKPAPGLKWVDIGCGNGAFTELIVSRCAPAEVQGIDPSEGQLAFARTRPAGKVAHFRQGGAMELPYADKSFDAAVMALVIFFVPDPKKGVAEMVRVVRPGGIIAAYAWDMHGGGFPLAPLTTALRESGSPVPDPPRSDASKLDAMQQLWTHAGLEGVETRQITVQRTFENFDDFWSASSKGSSVGQIIANVSPADLESLKGRLRTRLPADAAGRITYSARANAVKGRVPG
jgi:ubiquinone/menaquinone biosynthesis C-methylase UbiE